MRPRRRDRRAWVPAVTVGTVVLLAGARLITLSAHEHAGERHGAAQEAASRYTRSLERELQGLLERAQAEARRAAGADGALSLPPLTGSPGPHAFWMTGGTVLHGGDPDPAVSNALAAEWAAAQAAGRAGAIFGPVRYGSQWFAAAQVPVELPARPGLRHAAAPQPPQARAVAYEALGTLLLQAGMSRLAGDYDVELLQQAQGAGEPRRLLSYGTRAPADPVTAAVIPGGAPPSSAYLELAISPRGGWYPPGIIAAQAALLALVTWVLAFGAYDLVHALRRAGTALGAARTRLRTVNARLAQEIEQHQALQKSLEHARYHDPSTGLPNRRYFMNQLDRALRDLHARRRQRVAVVLIGIDRFSFINDTLGHTAGDELLLQAAQRFARALEGRESTLARWGGDQCAVLLYEAESSADVGTIAAALHNTRQEPFALRKHRVKAALRIGFTCVEGGPRSPEEVLREADVALTAARRPQSPLTIEYRPDMGGAATSLVSLEADMQLALERGEFMLMFQPIYDLRRARVAGLEALLRWRHPVEGLLPPERFLAIAEESGTIVPITRWVIQRVCRHVAGWRRSLSPNADFYVSINLSAMALQDPGLPAYLAQVLQDTRVPPGYLKFEFAERGLAENVSAAREALTVFHGMGIELMLDDFGTGYSPLNYLQLVPFDFVKIDRPFVNRTGSERANNAIAAALLQLTASLGLRSIAEVVETEVAARTLARLGCDYAQGYYFSAPVEAEQALEQLLRPPTPTIRSTIPVVPALSDEPAADTATLVLAAGPISEASDEEQPNAGSRA